MTNDENEKKKEREKIRKPNEKRNRAKWNSHRGKKKKKRKQRTDGDSISIRRPLAQKLDRPGELAGEIKLVNRDATFRLVSKNKSVPRSKRNCLLFILCGLVASFRRDGRTRGLRARNEFRVKNGGEEREESRERKRRRRRRVSVSGGAIYRSAEGRVKEAWKSVSRERDPGREVGRITEIQRVLLSAGQQHRRRRLFEEFAPASRVGAFRGIGADQRLSCEIKNALDSRR